jgi:uncharacterized protein
MTMEKYRYIYLHGFASSPDSRKARYLADRFAELGLHLEIPDLNAGDFSHTTLSRQISQVNDLLSDPNRQLPTVLIGSSLGGLIATIVAQNSSKIAKLILLAPAFQFLDFWLPRIGEDGLQLWQRNGYLPVYHYREKEKIPLHYQFIIDAEKYRNIDLDRPIPILIIHGINDETIPIKASRNFLKNHPQTHLIELESNHDLTDANQLIWTEINRFSTV